MTSIRCDNCRFWTLLRSGAVIGRCGHADSRAAFPRGGHCCSLWEQDRRQAARPLAEQPGMTESLSDGMPEEDRSMVRPPS